MDLTRVAASVIEAACLTWTRIIQDNPDPGSVWCGFLPGTLNMVFNEATGSLRTRRTMLLRRSEAGDRE